MKQCMCLYLRMKDLAFVGSRPYPSDPLESVLKENLGEYTVMSEIKHPKLMVAALMADRKPVDLHMFRNYKCASDILGITTPLNNRRIPPPAPGLYERNILGYDSQAIILMNFPTLCFSRSTENQLIWRAARATGNFGVFSLTLIYSS